MFKKSKVLTLNQVSEMRKCSIRTVQRQFTELNVLRSYNKNSRYYTLHSIPKFNKYGIWSFRDILFSKYGDLRQTVKQLILASERGLSGNEIGGIVHLLPRSFMHHFREMEGISREKHDGVYVYFSNDPAICKNQIFNRVHSRDAQRVSDAVGVKILVGYIRYPELSAEELSIILRRQENCYVSPSAITEFLTFHDLLKKTPDPWP